MSFFQQLNFHSLNLFPRYNAEFNGEFGVWLNLRDLGVRSRVRPSAEQTINLVRCTLRNGLQAILELNKIYLLIFSSPSQTFTSKHGVDDMVMLSKISNDAIVENLKKRYTADVIYVS